MDDRCNPGTESKILSIEDHSANEMAYVAFTDAGNIVGYHGTVSDTAAFPGGFEYSFYWVEYQSEVNGDDGILRVWHNTNGDRDTAALVLEITTGNGG